MAAPRRTLDVPITLNERGRLTTPRGPDVSSDDAERIFDESGEHLVGDRVEPGDSDVPPPATPRNVVTAGISRAPSRNVESGGKSRCADRLVDVLVGAGIDTVYGVPG